MEAGLPGARSLAVIERSSTLEENEEPALAFYTTSHAPTPGCARGFGELARGHWGGSESRNHWVRDACMGEDQTRSKNDNLNCALAALRICLLALKADLHPETSWPELQERSQHDPNIPFQALLKHRSK